MKPVLHNGAAYMMGGDLFGISDLFGLVLSRVEPETQSQALGIAALAIIITRTKATPGIIKVESGILKAESTIAQTEGKIIGLGIDDDLALHRGTGAITWKEAGWQKAGLTNVDWGKVYIDKYHFKSSFYDATKNAAAIRFEVTNFNPLFHKPGMTNFEFNHILSNPALLQKTTFVKNRTEVIWDGAQFISK